MTQNIFWYHNFQRFKFNLNNPPYFVRVFMWCWSWLDIDLHTDTAWLPPSYSISQEICTRFCFAMLCCGYTLNDFPISIRLTSLALWQTIAPVPAKQPWWIWINTSCEFIMNDCITTTKQSTTKPCAYFLGYTVPSSLKFWKQNHISFVNVRR